MTKSAIQRPNRLCEKESFRKSGLTGYSEGGESACARSQICVRTQVSLRAHADLLPCARKFTSVRTQICPLYNRPRGRFLDGFVVLYL